MVLSEIELIANSVKRDEIYRLLERLPREVVKISKKTFETADRFLRQGIITDYMDILHLTLADLNHVDFFLTCDDELIQKKNEIEEFLKRRFKVINPIDFIKETEVRL